MTSLTSHGHLSHSIRFLWTLTFVKYNLGTNLGTSWKLSEISFGDTDENKSDLCSCCDNIIKGGAPGHL